MSSKSTSPYDAIATPNEMQATIAIILELSSFSLNAAETRSTETGVKALILRFENGQRAPKRRSASVRGTALLTFE